VSQPKFKTKEARALARRIRELGGTVAMTRNGHLRVTGPAGYTVLAPDLTDVRTRRNTVAQLARIGLSL
jgi:hypothetical protein